MKKSGSLWETQRLDSELWGKKMERFLKMGQGEHQWVSDGGAITWCFKWVAKVEERGNGGLVRVRLWCGWEKKDEGGVWEELGGKALGVGGAYVVGFTDTTEIRGGTGNSKGVIIGIGKKSEQKQEV